MPKRLALLVIFLFLICSPPASWASETTSIITHQDVYHKDFNPGYLRQIFSGRLQYWENGEKIKVYVLTPSSDTHQDFCREQLRMFCYQLERLWNQVTYSGQGDPPIIVDSLDELEQKVTETPGAIGYIKHINTTRMAYASAGGAKQ